MVNAFMKEPVLNLKKKSKIGFPTFSLPASTAKSFMPIIFCI